AYGSTHGCVTDAGSRQNAAAGKLIAAGADVAGIGGFSGRESQVSIAWLADAIDRGQIRWVLADDAGGGRGLPSDTRVGARDVMSAVRTRCATASVSGLYDCRGHAAALRSDMSDMRDKVTCRD